MARPAGIEPAHLAPEASALSPELRARYTPIVNPLRPVVKQGWVHGSDAGGGARLFKSLQVNTRQREEFIEITRAVQAAVAGSGVARGVCVLYVPHTTAGLLINENADQDVIRDLAASLERLVPSRGDYAHREGNAHAHIKSSMLGCSAYLIIQDRRLLLGTWQGIFFCEFDGPRQRRLYLEILQDDSLESANNTNDM